MQTINATVDDRTVRSSTAAKSTVIGPNGATVFDMAVPENI